MSIKGRSTRGRLEEHTSNRDNRDFNFVTISNAADKVLLDTRSVGVFRVGAIPRTAELGSTDTIIKLTAHDFKVGDLVRPITTAVELEENFFTVKRIIDVDFVEIDAVLSASLTAGDTFEILRPVIPRYTADGATLSSVTSGPVSFNLDGAVVEVNEDTIVPSNNVPLPVKLTGVTGDISITAGDLNVQLSHLGAVNYDSTRIGDGTNLLGVDTANQAKVVMTDVGLTPSSVRIGDGVETLLISTTGQAETHSSHVGAAASSVQVGDGTEVLLISTTGQAEAHIKHDGADYSATRIGDGTTLLGIDVANQAKVVESHLGANASSTKIGDGTNLLGIDAANQAKIVATAVGATASSVRVSNGTNEMAVNANLQAEAHITHVGAANSSVRIGDGTNLAAVDAGLQLAVKTTAVGANASSILISDGTTGVGVTLANELKVSSSQLADLDVLGKARIDMSITNITTAAYLELFATVGVKAVRAIQCFTATGTPIDLALGAAASEVDKMIIPPGGFPGHVMPVAIPAGTRVSLKAVGANIITGQLIINLLG